MNKQAIKGVAISAAGVILAGLILSYTRESISLMQTAANGFDQ
jgi:hypothetical protein